MPSLGLSLALPETQAGEGLIGPGAGALLLEDAVSFFLLEDGLSHLIFE